MTATRILPYLLALLPTAALSAEATLYLENDVMHGEDRDYTSGLRYAWISDNFVGSDTGCCSVPISFLSGTGSAFRSTGCLTFRFRNGSSYERRGADDARLHAAGYRELISIQHK